MRIGYEAIRMFISYPHARFLSTFEGNKLNRGHLRRQSTQGWRHRPQGWRHRPQGRQDRPDRWIPGPLHAQVNPTGGSPGRPPTLPPIGPSCAWRGYHYQSRGPRAQSRIGGYLGPFMRRLTPQVVAQAGRPHCHLSGPAAQERVTTTSKRAHRPTRAQSGARAQNHGVNVQTLPTRRREQMPPPSIPTFPHQKAKKSHYKQHAVSYNPALTALSRKQTRPWPAHARMCAQPATASSLLTHCQL